MVTPAHIVPEWYFLPFYAVLRSIPDKLEFLLWVVLVYDFNHAIVEYFEVRSSAFRPTIESFSGSYWLIS